MGRGLAPVLKVPVASINRPGSDRPAVQEPLPPAGFSTGKATDCRADRPVRNRTVHPPTRPGGPAGAMYRPRFLERLSMGLRTIHTGPTPGRPRRRRPWPARVGICPEGGDQEPDDRQHGKAVVPEVVPLQGRETDAESRDDEEELADGKTRWMHRDSPMSDPCILLSSAKAVNDLAGRRSPRPATAPAQDRWPEPAPTGFVGGLSSCATHGLGALAASRFRLFGRLIDDATDRDATTGRLRSPRRRRPRSRGSRARRARIRPRR
jgi:hypothetical protein